MVDRASFASSPRHTQNLFASTPLGGQSNPVPCSDTAFCDHIEFAVSASTWCRVRTQLLDTNTCLVLNAFAISDKQFQTALLASSFPDSLYNVGKKDFSQDAWRDVKEFFEALDVWNFY